MCWDLKTRKLTTEDVIELIKDGAKKYYTSMDIDEKHGSVHVFFGNKREENEEG